MKSQRGRNYGHTESKKSDGSYTFNNVAPGEYIVIAVNDLGTASSDPFEVIAGENYIVPDLEILTHGTADSISGTVTFNRLPLDNEILLLFSENHMIHNESKVTNGKFEAKALPGRYAVSCVNKKVATVVDLKSSSDNHINFESGDSTFDFVFGLPLTNKWIININLIIKYGNIKIPVVITSLQNKKIEKISNVQAGEYLIYAFCCSGDIRTNLTIETTIKSGETKKVRF